MSGEGTQRWLIHGTPGTAEPGAIAHLPSHLGLTDATDVRTGRCTTPVPWPRRWVNPDDPAENVQRCAACRANLPIPPATHHHGRNP